MFASRTLRALPRSPFSLFRHFSITPTCPADFTHTVIGGGVVGLAISHQLAQNHPSASTLLLERHLATGTETSSRNSEVLHAGIYYGLDSKKTRLCIRGRQLAYNFCARYSIGHQKLGKWIVAQNSDDREALERVSTMGKALDVAIRWVSEKEAKDKEPEVRAEAGILESPETGIIDSHGLMIALQGHFEEAGGTVALGSNVIGVESVGDKGSSGWKIYVKDATSGSISIISTEVLINAAGLGSVAINNLIAPERKRELFYAKGNYFSYSGSVPKTPKRLVYPAPTSGGGGLGTHLTLDLSGRMRFGPDVEWVDSPDDLAVNTAQLGEAISEIKKYLPSVDETLLVPDYSGIRPKLARAGAVGQGKGFQDFIIRKEEGYSNWVNLLGIESPGLTSSLAIAEEVESLLYK